MDLSTSNLCFSKSTVLSRPLQKNFANCCSVGCGKESKTPQPYYLKIVAVNFIIFPSISSYFVPLLLSSFYYNPVISSYLISFMVFWLATVTSFVAFYKLFRRLCFIFLICKLRKRISVSKNWMAVDEMMNKNFLPF